MKLIKSEGKWVGVLLVLTSSWWLLLKSLDSSFFLVDNNANFFLPAYVHNYQSLVDGGELARLNYHQLLGNVHWGQGQTGVLYPWVYVSLWAAEVVLGDVLWGIDVLTLIHWWLAAGGMYGLMRWFGVKRRVAVVTGLIWVSLPFGVGVGRSWIVMVYLLVYLPWSYWMLEGYLGGNRERYWWGMVGMRWLLMLAGYVQWVVMALVLEMVYLGLRRINLNKKKLVGVGLSWVVAGGMGAPVLLPLWKAAGRSVARSQQITWQQFIENAVMVGDWVRAQIWIFEDGVLFDGSTYVYHLGLLWVVMWLVIWRIKKGTSDRAKWKLYAVMAVTAGGLSTVMYGLVYLVPILNWFRWPFKYLMFGEFFLLISMVLGWSGGKGWSQKWLIWGLVVGIGINMAVISVYRSPEFSFSDERLAVPIEVSWTSEVDSNVGRMVVFGQSFNEYGSQINKGGYGYANLLGEYYFGGYDATLNRELWMGIGGMPVFGALLGSLDPESVGDLQDWGVRYWVTDNDEEMEQLLSEVEDMELVYEASGIQVAVAVAKPYVYMNADRDRAVTHEFGVNSVTAWPETSGDLVFNVFAWPEYGVYINGEKAGWRKIENRPVVKILEPGVTVKLVYEDEAINRGWLVAGMTLLVAFVWRLMERRRRG